MTISNVVLCICLIVWIYVPLFAADCTLVLYNRDCGCLGFSGQLKPASFSFHNILTGIIKPRNIRRGSQALPINSGKIFKKFMNFLLTD